MFDFQNLEVYRKAKVFHQSVNTLVQNYPLANPERNQLQRASLSVVLNIAEGAGRFTNPDKRNFYIIARGSVYECLAIIDLLCDSKAIEKEQYEFFFRSSEEISKMLYALIRNHS